MSGPHERTDSHEVTDVAKQSETPDRTAEWATVLETMTEYDERLLGDWKDDLSSLLVFAGLFSSVVSGFVVESLQWLQPDPSPDLSAILLAQISKQLALSLPASPEAINMTQSLSFVNQLHPQMSPSPSSVRINTLWFLSLGLSLTASLFAIMVQQWLREYRLPEHLSTRERVRLRQLRYQALQDWSVPSIVSLLPVLLQAALILFLTGLCHLLFTLDSTVAIVFVSFVGVAMSAYFAFVVMPILFRRCPYRNPLSHVMLSIIQFVPVVWYSIFVAAAWLGYQTLVVTALLYHFVCTTVPTSLEETLDDIESKLTQAASILRSLTQRPVGDHSLWRKRDVAQLVNEADSPSIDHDALAWALSVFPMTKLSTFSLCLQDLPRDRRIGCVIAWVAGALHVDMDEFDVGPDGNKSAYGCVFSVPSICAKFDITFIGRFKDCLLGVLPTTFPLGGIGPRFAYSVLILLYKFAQNGATKDFQFRRAFANRLLNIVATQTQPPLESAMHRWACVPSLCLFDLAHVYKYPFTMTDLHTFFDHALRVHDAASRVTYSLGNYQWSQWNDGPELVIALHVVPLLISSHQPTSLLHDTALRRKCLELLVKLDSYLLTDSYKICVYGRSIPDFFEDGISFEIKRSATVLCQSVATLVDAGVLGLESKMGTDGLTVALFLDHAVDVLGSISQDVVNSLHRLRGRRHIPPDCRAVTLPPGADVETCQKIIGTKDAAQKVGILHGKQGDSRASTLPPYG